MTDLRTILIDGQEHAVDPNLTVLQACEQAGREIPRFCYHERLSIAGNCRMCLVETVGGPKPAASCAMQVRDLRGGRNGEPPEVLTNSPMVKKAREGVMEFLLINHPLDCPICDQGGECDLQDQAMAYGRAGSKYHENKRAHDEIHLGPLIKTAMTRCIHCTRCVRFTTEIAGVTEMGSTGRGEDAEIISYLDQALTSELQGNVIDLCPVGALTSAPYAFAARPWELTKTETVDVMDALGANIRVDARGKAPLRILPRNHDDVNEEWISDKTRFCWDGLSRQRLDQPYLREGGRLRPATWAEAFGAIKTRLNGVSGDKIAALAGDLASVESMFALKTLMGGLGATSLDCRQDGAKLPPENRSAWVFNPTVAGLDDADAVLIIGSNPRMENPVLNARLRKAWLRGADIAVIGEQVDLTYDYAYLGAGPETLASAADLPFVSETLKNAKNPVVILGAGAVARDDGAAVLGHAMTLAETVGATFGVLHTAASRVGGLEIGFTPGDNGRDAGAILAGCADGSIDAVFALGVDEIDIPAGPFVIYQGHHGDRGAHRADVILPGAAWTEEPGLFVNLEGRPQMALKTGFAPGDARENWTILRALAAELGLSVGFDSLEELRGLIFADHPHLAAIDAVQPADWRAEAPAEMDSAAFVSPIADFYMTNPIARASETLAACSKLAQERRAAAAE